MTAHSAFRDSSITVLTLVMAGHHVRTNLTAYTCMFVPTAMYTDPLFNFLTPDQPYIIFPLQTLERMMKLFD